MHKTIIFDFDGTIADTFEDAVTILYEISVQKKLPLTKSEIREDIRNISLKEIIAKFKINKIKLVIFIWQVRRKFQDKTKNIKIFDNISEVIEKLSHNGYKLGLVTSNEKLTVINFLEEHKINLFDFIYCKSTLFGKDKLLKRAIRENNLQRKDIIYIGDEVRDIVACRNIKIRIIAVCWGYNSKELLKKENPDFLVKHPKEILKLTMEDFEKVTF